VRLEGITKRYGKVTALADVSFQVQDQEFFCILGPSGAGKTSILHIIAGLEAVEEGRVYIDDQLMTGVHPSRRDVAVLFANLALYPHMTGFANIAFPLRQRKLLESEVREMVMEVASTLHIEHLLDRQPSTYSGGERQRVALGRCLVRRPKVYLLDEPLGNLDAKLRMEMRGELKRLQHELGQTMIYVTPDEVEAMAMADRILVLNRGRIEQCDVPINIYNHPASRFMAGFVGTPLTNFVTCTLTRKSVGQVALCHPAFTLDVSHLASALNLQPDGSEITLAVRPEDVHMKRDGPITASVYVVEHLGRKSVIDLKLGTDLIKAIGPEFAEYRYNEAQHVSFDLNRIHLMETKSGRVLV
jgi:ABC-type sugar transport system ATPase subunit